MALNYDEHEQTAPAAFAASMMLFNTVVDALERSREGDARWLDAATQAMSSASGWGQSEMRRLLLVVRQVPERAELCDVALTGRELTQAVTSVLQILQIYRAAGSTGR